MGASASTGAGAGSPGASGGADDQPPVKSGQDSYGSWFSSSKPKSASEIRDEKYCTQLVCLSGVLDRWRSGDMKTQEALCHADYHMEKIQEVGRVDAENAREILARKGIDDKKREELQKAYLDLKKACGQRVPQFDDEGRHVQDRGWHKVCC
mmetsp:Transcript_58342/g.169286  ORF Transcript_58342/g.169286 Transcript_58342/m.169286 type:complete len:152 (-) Transcript_58342:168-623(-)